MAAVHSDQTDPYFSLEVIMYEIKSSDYKKKTSWLFTNEIFRAAVRELVESERDIELVEAEFSRDCGFNKCHYHVHHI